LISIGAYPAGSNAAIDNAIRLSDPLKKFLCQGIREGFDPVESWRQLQQTMCPSPPVTPMRSATLR
jgi:flagellar biosynthesis/type III secretory pathway ATPase